MGRLLSILFFIFLLAGCSSTPPVATEQAGKLPDMFPDYTAVTIPENMAPLTFKLLAYQKGYATFSTEGYSFFVSTDNSDFSIPLTDWKKLMSAAKGKTVEVTIVAEDKHIWKAFLPFTISVSADPIDPYIAYRLIDPGYQLWSTMGIYQRDLTSFKEYTILENRQTDSNCMNCHSFCMQDPDKMLLHIRAKHGCTVFVDGDKIETFDTKTKQTISALVYPSWHPSGKYMAFSVNNTTQDTHPVHRTEVYDKASDVVVYDVDKQEIVTTRLLFSPNRFETFPTFSPDGKSLYYCSAPAMPMPDSIIKLKYSLCRIAFDPEKRSFGTIADTLYQADIEQKSILFPRVSPDGKFLLCTTTNYGTFPIWHKDADLLMFDLNSGNQISVDTANSDDTESYHSWSSNSKWVVFSSRRLDGLYTRLFISHVAEDGTLSKPFLLPQQSSDYYIFQMKSYNIPEFIKGKIRIDAYSLATRIKEGKNQPVHFAGMAN